MVMPLRPRMFRRSESGATMIEMTIVIQLLFIAVFGFIDFGFALFQWNQASKAVQIGARLAAVSGPVDSSLSSYTGGSGDPTCVSGSPGCPGGPMIPFATRTCDRVVVGNCTNGGTFDADRFNRIWGGSDRLCPSPVGRLGMCDIFSRIERQHIVVTYEYSGLGYATRPGGPIPTIQVRLQNMTFDYFFLDGLLGFAQLTIPSMTSTITGEDLSTTWTN